MADRGGYALRRNGSCLSTENECGKTTPPFYACCPSHMFCPKGQFNVVCCLSEGNSEQTRSDGCADPLANLYTTDVHNLTDGGFCCAQNKHGFSLLGDGAGCADERRLIQTGQFELSILSSASATPKPSSTSSPVVVSASTTASSMPTSTTEGKPASPNNTGAIAGGVVGGVGVVAIMAALLWFLFRRRKNAPQASSSNELYHPSETETRSQFSQNQHPPKAEYQRGTQEIGTRRETQVAELSSGR